MGPRLAALGLLALSLGCGSGSSEQGSITLLLKDAPGDEIRAAMVTISSVQARALDGRVRTLRSTPLTVDLMTLTERPATLVDGIAIPAGQYDELRLLLDGAFLEVAGESGDRWIFATEGYAALPEGRPADGGLQVPATEAPGYAVKLPNGGFEIDPVDERTTMVVDFDVAESFQHDLSGTADWVMRPALTAFERAAAGEVDVTVKPIDDRTAGMLGLFAVQLLDAGGQLEGERRLVDEDGDHTFSAHFGMLNPEEGPFGAVLVGPVDLAFRVGQDDTPVSLVAGGHAAASRTVELVDTNAE